MEPDGRFDRLVELTGVDDLRDRLEADRSERDPSKTVKRVLFRDDRGLLVFLGSLLFFSLLLRTDVFINDSFALANAIISASRGNIVLTEFVLGPDSGVTPGVFYTDGKLVARNYGQVTATVPVYLVLTGLTYVFELRPLLIGLWALLLYAFLLVAARQTGIGGPRTAGVVTVVAFVVNLAASSPIPQRLLAYVAMQVTTMVVAAFIGVLLYRFFRTELSPDAAATVGLLATVGTPVGFFATVPKRHSYSALLILLAMFSLYQSRTAERRASGRWYKALAYGTIGTMAWINPPEGVVLFLAVLLGDIAGTRSLDLREVAFSLTALIVSFVPFFLTNVLISGDPFTPPRRLQRYEGQSVDIGGGGGGGETPSDGTPGETPSDGTPGETGDGTPGGTGDGTPGAGTPSDGTPGGTGDGSSVVGVLRRSFLALVGSVYNLLLWGLGLIQSAVATVGLVVSVVTEQAGRSLQVVQDVDEFSKIFFRRGYVRGSPPHAPAAVNLSVLESMPVLGMLGSYLTGVLSLRRATIRRWYTSSYFSADIAALVYATLILLLSLPKLPQHASFTVRYLHALYPIGLYALCRLSCIQSLFRERLGTIQRAFVGTVAVSTPAYVASVLLLADVSGEAVQLYAIPSFAVGMVVLTVTVVATHRPTRRTNRAMAVAAGVGFGMVTTYLLGSSIVVYGSEQNFLPIIDLLSELFRYTS